jgi:hypothetical protein
MGPNLTLVNVATLRFKNIFDRVLKSKDMVFAVFINKVNEGSHGCGLTRTHRTGDENQTILITSEGLDVLDGKTEVFHRSDCSGDDSENDFISKTLLHD